MICAIVIVAAGAHHARAASDMARFQLSINGLERTVDVPTGTSLLEVLRDELDLTGAKYGCGEGRCGACVVLVEETAVPSCRLAVETIGTRGIRTIEGIGGDTAVARAFVAEGAMQCGYCTPGLVIAATALLARVPDPTDEDVREALGPHLCRCGVYGRVVRAVQRAAREAR
jgi:aerobic-type carbon monoxide dehydrogenase small subunit (CoxS/CutS family)